jgi:hypothetical protein
MTKWRRGKNQINKIRGENGDINTNTNVFQWRIGEYTENYIQVNWKM